MSEQKIQKSLFLYLKRKYKRAKEEVPALNRRADIVYINEKKELVTIEVKLKNWKQAIRQAVDHQLYADRAYICMPQNIKTNKRLTDELSKHGVGLLLVNVSNKRIYVKTEIEAERTKYYWKQTRVRVENLIYA